MDKKLEKRDNEAKIVTAAAMVSIFAYSFVISLTNVLVNEIIDGFSLTGASQGLMSSMLSLGFMLALLIAPVMQGRVEKLTMLVLSCSLQAAMLLASGISPDFTFFCASYVVLGIGGGVADAYSNSSVVDVRKDDGPKYLGFLHGLFGVGSLIAPVAIYRMQLMAGWRGVHYILAVAMAAAALVVFILSRRSDKNNLTAATRERKLKKSDLIEYIQNRRNLILIMAGAFASATQTGILMWIVRYMTLRFDAAALGALSVSVYWVCATINRFCIARIKIQPMKLFAVGGVFSAVFLLTGVMSAGSVVMCVMMGAIGLSSGHFMPVLYSQCAIGYDGKTTFTTSAVMLVTGIVRIIVPLVTAYISSVTSVGIGMTLPAITALIAAGFGFMTVREDSRRRSNRA